MSAAWMLDVRNGPAALKLRLQVPGALGREGAYDNFHPDCVGAFDPVPQRSLDRLVETRVLRGYELVPEG